MLLSVVSHLNNVVFRTDRQTENRKMSCCVHGSVSARGRSQWSQCLLVLLVYIRSNDVNCFRSRAETVDEYCTPDFALGLLSTVVTSHPSKCDYDWKK